MPIFVPAMDQARARLGRPSAMWFTTAWEDAWTLVLRDGEWELIQTPERSELVSVDRVWQQRENFVEYWEVRDLDLTSLGSVHYVDDYSDEWNDFFICEVNTPFDRATTPEPVG